MLIVLLLFFVFCLYGIRLYPHKQGAADYLSPDNTNAIKGIFILIVFFSHFNSYAVLTNADDPYRQFFWFLGQAMVTLFLFYSGYGVMESFKRKGRPYILGFPLNRLLATMFRLDAAVLLFLVLGLLLGDRFSAPQILLSLIGWESLGNSNWYMFVILLLYLFTYLAFLPFKKPQPLLSTAIVCILTAAFVVLCIRYNLRPAWWYDTCLCYCLGMGYSLVKAPIERGLLNNRPLYLLALAACVLLFVFLNGKAGIKVQLLKNLVFTVAVVLLTMRVSLRNPALRWCGKHLFEIYILQRIPMIVFQRLGVSEWNTIVYFAVCLVCTVLLVFPFRMATDRIWNLITAKRRTA